jgi:hypothetical protein
VFDFFKRRADRLFISRDRVNCPLRKADVGIAACGGCPWIVEIREDANPPYLRCTPANRGHPLHLWI